MDYEKLKKIYLTNANGEKEEYDTLGLIQNEDGNYIVYTDNTTLSNGNIKLYVNSITNENGEIVFNEVDDEELQKVIKEIQERISK